MFQNARQYVQRKTGFDFFRFGRNIIVACVAAAVGLGNFRNVVLFFDNLNRRRFVIKRRNRTGCNQVGCALARQSLNGAGNRPVAGQDCHGQVFGNVCAEAGNAGQTELGLAVVERGSQVQAVLVAVVNVNLQNLDADGNLPRQARVLLVDEFCDFGNIVRGRCNRNCAVGRIHGQLRTFVNHGFD